MTPGIAVGTRVSVRECACHVRFVGTTRFADGTWVGVEFDMACGRNDGSIDGVQYFDCLPRHGLFVRPNQVQPISMAAPRLERDAPEEHVDAWTAMENVMEVEALQAGRAGTRVLRHLEQLHPPAGADLDSPNRRSPGKSGTSAVRQKRRGPNLLTRQGSGNFSGAVDDSDPAPLLLKRYATLPPGYSGPSFSGLPTPDFVTLLLAHIKEHVVAENLDAAVPAKVAIDLLIAAKGYLEREASSLVELQLTAGRLVLVGDTHGQLNDFCWILKARLACPSQ